MSDAQIWLAIGLGFIVLITLVSRLARKGSGAPWPIEHAHEKEMLALAHGDTEQLERVAADTAEIKARLGRIEKLLKDVE